MLESITIGVGLLIIYIIKSMLFEKIKKNVNKILQNIHKTKIF